MSKRITDFKDFVFSNIGFGEVYQKHILEIGCRCKEGLKEYGPYIYVSIGTQLKDDIDVLCDNRNLIKVFDIDSFDVVIAPVAYEQNLISTIHNIKAVCKTGGTLIADFTGWIFDNENYIFSDFKIIDKQKKFINAIKLGLPEVNLAKAKVKKKKQLYSGPIAQYVGSTEIYIPKFKKIVNRGDYVEEFPIEEARRRSDFIVINESEE